MAISLIATSKDSLLVQADVDDCSSPRTTLIVMPLSRKCSAFRRQEIDLIKYSASDMGGAGIEVCHLQERKLEAILTK